MVGDPYILIPRELWDNVVVFSNMVGVDVYVVFLNSVLEHINRERGKWSDKQKREFMIRIQQRKNKYKSDDSG